MSTDADAVVIGAGPAACAAAIAAAGRGLRATLIVPPKAGPRPGETLHPGVEAIFQTLGVTEEARHLSPIRNAGVSVIAGTQVRFHPFGSDASGPWLGFQIRGAELDRVLCARAESVGVSIESGVATELLFAGGNVCGVRIGRRSVFCDTVIDGTGRRKFIARRLGLESQRADGARVAWWGYAFGEAPATVHNPELVLFSRGYFWSARIDDRLFAWTSIGDSTRQRLVWPPRLAHLTPVGKPRAFNVTPSLVMRSAARGYVLVGDAACITDPLGSHGVLRALMSGILAAEVIAGRGASRSVRERGYQAWLTDSFHQEISALANLGFGNPL